MPARLHTDYFSKENEGRPRYEQIALTIAQAIKDGRLRPGERLPTVRQLATDLNVSMTTVSAAFNWLGKNELIRGEVGRGSFVSEKLATADLVKSDGKLPRFATNQAQQSTTAPWRRRALAASAARLKATYPSTIDCSTGRPDPSLLPMALISRHWQTTLNEVTGADLQYTTPDPLEALAAQVAPRLVADSVAARKSDLIVGSSAQQFMMLVLDVIARLSGSQNVSIAVEEPGYPTIFDGWERAGARLIGVTVDENGVVPESLASALEQGAAAVLLTPRAHNPTGISWTKQRASQLADAIVGHPDVVVVEDDQFAGLASSQPGSLLADSRVEEQVLYIRSFSKSIGPDLRVAVAAARPRLRALIQESKSWADGWTSRLLQRVLAAVLADNELDEWLHQVRNVYRIRREEAAKAINSLAPLANTSCGDGLNLWIYLPTDIDSLDVQEKAAAGGILVASGEPFYLRPGRSDVVRLNAGSIPTEMAPRAGKILADAILRAGSTERALIHV
jgi:GntR family transcriptional regulator / MocR family aminotransferase